MSSQGWTNIMGVIATNKGLLVPLYSARHFAKLYTGTHNAVLNLTYLFLFYRFLSKYLCIFQPIPQKYMIIFGMLV